MNFHKKHWEILSEYYDSLPDEAELPKLHSLDDTDDYKSAVDEFYQYMDSLSKEQVKDIHDQLSKLELEVANG